jgi:hypothetical protein
MKTFVLMISRQFPSTHKRKGEETEFSINIIHAITPAPFIETVDKKLHTIRANYEFWEKRIKQVQEGKAILSLRFWSGKPYNSKQVEICQLDKDSGIGVQQIGFFRNEAFHPLLYLNNIKGINEKSMNAYLLAENDGLPIEDFAEWFKNYDLSKSMAIIHFTKFRY